MGQVEQDPDLIAPLSKQCFGQSPISPLFNWVAGQVEVPAGQVNFRAALYYYYYYYCYHCSVYDDEDVTFDEEDDVENLFDNRPQL